MLNEIGGAMYAKRDNWEEIGRKNWREFRLDGKSIPCLRVRNRDIGEELLEILK